MALVDVVGGVWMPEPTFFNAVAPAYTSVLLDAAADRWAAIFYAPKTGNIRKIGFLIGAVTALGGSSTLTYSLQDVSLTTGNPDDTDDQTATIANASIVADTLVLSGALSADRAVTKGDLLAAVVKYGTFTAGDQVNIKSVTSTIKQAPNNDEYVVINTSGTYAKASSMPPLEVEYDDGTHAWSTFLAFPWSALNTDTYNNTSTPDEIGLRFQVPFACRLAGCWLSLDRDGDINFNLYSASAKTTVLAAIDKDVRTSLVHGTSLFHFTTPAILAASTTYVLAVEPTSATSIVLSNNSVRAAVALDQMVGGQAWHYATAKDPATTADFTMTTTKRPIMGLMFDQVDNGAGGGGSGLLKLRP